MQGVYKISDYTFVSREEYQAGIRDAKKILGLQVQETDDYRTARRLSKVIAQNHISFESAIGQSFLEKIDMYIREHRRRIIRRLLKGVSYAILLGGAVYLGVEGMLQYRSSQSIGTLQARVEQKTVQQAEGLQEKSVELDFEGNDKDSVTQKIQQQPAIAENEEENILPEYKELYEENADIKGWLTIEGTGLQYPVMQGPDNEYYLSHNFQKEYDKNGLLVMDVRCTDEAESPQYIVYGHNVQSGRMFGELLNYKEEAYFQFHPGMQFDTLTEKGYYNIVAVFRTSMNGGVPFYEYTDFASQEEFQEYIDWVKEISLYDCGVTPVYGEPLVALVTCEYSEEDGRFVVLAAKEE